MLVPIKTKTCAYSCHGTMEIMSICFKFFYILARAGIYLFKVNNTNTVYNICSKSTRKSLNNVNDVVLVPLLLTLSRLYKLHRWFRCLPWTNRCWLGHLMSLKSDCFIFKSLTVQQILSPQLVKHVSKFQGTGKLLVIYEKVT